MGSLFSSNKSRKGGPPNAQVTEQDKAILVNYLFLILLKLEYLVSKNDQGSA
jgi:hypothetical protein